jgi:polyisoprenyl-phosphate glycosyltransferase
LKYKISIILPFFNEELSVDSFFHHLFRVLRSLKKYNFEFICINDGSSDSTLKQLIKNKKKNFKIVDFTRNFGKDAAISAGFNFSTGDAVIIMDTDLQHPPEVIPKLIKEWGGGGLYQLLLQKKSQEK